MQWLAFLIRIREVIFLSKLLQASRPQLRQVLIWLSSALRCSGWAWSQSENRTGKGQTMNHCRQWSLDRPTLRLCQIYQSFKGRLTLNIVVEVVPSYTSGHAAQQQQHLSEFSFE